MRLALVVLVLLAPGALAQPTGAIDARIELAPGAAPAIDAPDGLVTLADAEDGERYAFDLSLTQDYTTFEVRARGFGLERAKQLFPSLALPETEYPLFERFPGEDIWTADAPANVYAVSGTGDDVILRLGVAGPRNVTLVLARDQTPPAFTIGPVSELQHFSFYQETNTSELAIADLQVRKAGATEWVQNPTPVFHFRQRFPIQGLDADTEYEARVVFRDWSDNEATSETYRVRTTPAPVGPAIDITPLEPAPNATLVAGDVVIRARIDSPASPVTRSDVRLFFDKREVSDKLTFEDGVASYVPADALAAGPHSVAFEAVNAEGGKGLARWTFTIEGGERNETPAPPALAAAGLAALVGLGLARARRDRSQIRD